MNNLPLHFVNSHQSPIAGATMRKSQNQCGKCAVSLRHDVIETDRSDVNLASLEKTRKSEKVEEISCALFLQIRRLSKDRL